MPRKETLFDRPLRKPLDEATRRAIEGEYRKRRHEIPIPTELRWHATHPQFTIQSPLLSFIVNFTPDERLVVDAELSLAARLARLRGQPQAGRAVHRIDRGRPGPLNRTHPLAVGALRPMPEGTQQGQEVPFNLDLRSKDAEEVLAPDGQRFNFFLIDTGWNEAISQHGPQAFPQTPAPP